MIIQTCIRKVFVSNLVRDSGYAEAIFINLISCWQIAEYSTISEQSLPSKFSPIYPAPNFLIFDSV